MRLLVILHTKPCTKFEVSSSSSFRDIALIFKRIGVTSLTFQGHGQGHRSRDHSIAHIPFPVGGPLEPSLYL